MLLKLCLLHCLPAFYVPYLQKYLPQAKFAVHRFWVQREIAKNTAHLLSTKFLSEELKYTERSFCKTIDLPPLGKWLPLYESTLCLKQSPEYACLDCREGHIIGVTYRNHVILSHTYSAKTKC